MNEIVLARVIHVLAVVLWIGGVAMVTTVLIPAIKGLDSSEDKVALFEKLEGRFSWQAKITTLLTGLSGFYLIHVFDAWQRYTDPSFWWIHAMTLVWVIFTLVLFVLEPMFLHKWFHQRAQKEPAKTFVLIHRFHAVLLLLSLLTIAGAVSGSHGWFWF